MPTHYQGTTEEILALDAFIKLNRSVIAVQGRLLPALQREFGLTESQIAVLEALKHLGPLQQGELCQKILRSGSNVTTVVDNLERDGLVQRSRDESDRRIQVVNLTEKGRELVDRALPVHVGRITDTMAALEPEEQRELGRLCRKLGRAGESK
ncbi:MAG: MarR family transcriptional regulator [Gemmatimonadaceae bacterium]|nr:MarR family transcriptional regulator [Gemmatimonadaceae bacterium]NUO94406.1 MarR family transcriptional regulator [Gemmatimonadaceae bacterium]NUP55072.1 MarR family transcriptional regulator [Gemmatimonadaceae bacterium]NUP69685.1 MarR family transcriptional regulator [Gemmatimonadaceae bacterium]NUR34563.1 MarR family transcriptional regulator [Gemmatimonadaceae bacterium]